MLHSTQTLPKEIGETKILAHFLTGRYGSLALARAAGEAPQHVAVAIWIVPFCGNR